MKANKISIIKLGISFIFFLTCFSWVMAQELETSVEKAPRKYVKNTFESVWLIDNQTVMVPYKGTFEFDIAHRFGKVNNGFEDLYGLFAPSNIRFGVSYAPIQNLNVGCGLTKERMILDGSIKYAILKQTQDSWTFPVSITYYGNMSYDLKEDPDKSLYKYETDRLRFFNQLDVYKRQPQCYGDWFPSGPQKLHLFGGAFFFLYAFFCLHHCQFAKWYFLQRVFSEPRS